MRHLRSVAVLAAVPLFLAACAGEQRGDGMPGDGMAQDGMARDGMDPDAMGEDGMAHDGMGGDGMGGDGMAGDGALGGSAETTVLAEATVQMLPEGSLAWSGFAVSDVQHEHAAAFVHARAATSLTVDGQDRELPAGEAVFVPAGTPHQHGPGTAWDVLLADPAVDAPPGATGEPVFRSDTLDGVPAGAAQLRAVLVELPAGTATSVHTHPGPEFIYATSGEFVYQNALVGETRTREGDGHTLPADTAVQKRNPEGSDTAVFLSWFVVEPDEEFAPPAHFDR